MARAAEKKKEKSDDNNDVEMKDAPVESAPKSQQEIDALTVEGI